MGSGDRLPHFPAKPAPSGAAACGGLCAVGWLPSLARPRYARAMAVAEPGAGAAQPPPQVPTPVPADDVML
eukprot:3094699-Heterocapsa_arctica.AAC.1